MTKLAIIEVQDGPFNCGGTRGIDDVTLDGKSLNDKSMSFGGAPTNTITHIHEISHQALGHVDHSYTAGRLDITGPTCGGDPFFDYNSWHKLHLGWTTPTVVTTDGFYTVSRWDTSGQSFLLYDPDRGTDDYFLVENRCRDSGFLRRRCFGRPGSSCGAWTTRSSTRRHRTPPIS